MSTAGQGGDIRGERPPSRPGSVARAGGSAYRQPDRERGAGVTGTQRQPSLQSPSKCQRAIFVCSKMRSQDVFLVTSVLSLSLSLPNFLARKMSTSPPPPPPHSLSLSVSTLTTALSLSPILEVLEHESCQLRAPPTPTPSLFQLRPLLCLCLCLSLSLLLCLSPSPTLIY